ncbi:MAG: host-nuclease inhibitor Gam family protein [Deltaproteobacteria bacterium]|nr:host-nuclease inhibitor Gam family protein [Deltaproteobacteria bacterium]
MTKQRNYAGSHDEDDLPEVEALRLSADSYLHEISGRIADLKVLNAEAEAAMQEIKTRYALRIEARDVLLKSAITALMQTMKVNKKVLFDGTDVVRLVNGSLIHSVADKVTIPRDALAKCKELGFAEVIKVAESLDRDAVEKWPDERLILIGAERKQKEEFSYDLAEV